MKDHYATLGIAPDAMLDVIKAAYRKKAAKYHPDKNPLPEAMVSFIAAKEAYDVLSDQNQRKIYDDYRQRSLIEHPLPVAIEIFGNYIKSVIQ